MTNPISRCWNKDNKTRCFQRLLTMTIGMICNIMYFWVFEKHSTKSKYMSPTFISCQIVGYSCNMIFWWHNKRWCFFLLWCFVQSCLLLMLYKKVLFTTLCNIVLVEPFVVMKNVRDLVRNMMTQTFASSHLFIAMIFNESNWKRLIASQGRCWTKKREQLEICCF